MATIEELQAQIAALIARVDALTVPPNRYYSSRYTGETIDKLLTSISGGAADLDLSNLTDYQRALHNIGGRPNRNILRNPVSIGGGDPGKLPINQRGKKSYIDGITIDGWKSIGDGTQKVDVQTDGVLLTSSGQYKSYWVQDIEPAEIQNILGKTVTCSVYVGENTGYTPVFAVYRNGEYWKAFDAIENDISSLSFVVPEDTSKMYVQLGANGAGTAKFKAAKIEKSDRQTLGWKDSDGKVHLLETPNYGEELERCQRYLRAFNAWAKFAADYIDSNRIMFSIPGDMRADPAVSGFTLYNGLQQQSGFAFEAHRNGNNITVVATKNGHGLTDAWLGVEDSAYLSAEL